MGLKYGILARRGWFRVIDFRFILGKEIFTNELWIQARGYGSVENMRWRFRPGIYRCSRELLRSTFGRLFRVQVEGLGYLPKEGPAIICPKHQRWEDIIVTGLALPRPLRFIAKVELFQQPVVREFIGALGGVPVDRREPRATLSSFKELLPMLKERAYVVLYPEGTYVKGGVGVGKHRLIQLLLKWQARDGLGVLPFLPMGISYHKSSWSYEAKVKLGAPLKATGPEKAVELTRALMARIAELSGVNCIPGSGNSKL